MLLTRSVLLLCGVAGLGLAAEPTITTSDAVDEQGGHAFTVTNTSIQSLTGMIVKADRRPQNSPRDIHFRYFYDCFLNLQQRPLELGQSYTFHVGSDRGELYPMQISVEAAIFSDGTAIGDPPAIQSLWKRREWLAFEYREVLSLIDQNTADINDRAALVRNLTKYKEIRNAPNMSIEEREAIISAYGSVIGNIRDDTVEAPAAIISKIRERETQRATAIHSQLAPPQTRP